MTNAICDSRPSHGFLALLAEQIEVADSAAGANDYLGRPELADWWRGRASELRRYLSEASTSAYPVIS